MTTQNSISVNLQPLGKNIQVNPGTPLLDVLHEYGVEFPCGGKGSCGACKIKLIEGELPLDKVHQERLNKLELDDNWRLACFCKAESDLTLELAQLEHIILADNTTFDFIPQPGFGVAVDIGTTTLVAQLVDLKNGQILDSVTAVNPQTKFGGDLIARIQACLDGKQVEMMQLIRKKTADLIEEMLQKHPFTLKKIVLVGNTVMHHIFCGLNVEPLSMYPFQTDALGEQKLSPKKLNWNIPTSTTIQFKASIGSFVGSDILAGIAATRMTENEDYTLLIDLGTNGELVIGNKHQIICASTAAGPAFEGAKINQGMRATTGAISSVQMKNDQVQCHVIGNTPAKGICGSGLIDIMAILLENEQIGMFGEINSGEQKIPLTDSVSLTQQDIREFQLAKAAIAAGIQILLNQLNITISSINNVFIAGGFGNFLNIKNVIRTGLIEAEEEKIVKLGNTALIGAKMFLFENDDFSQNILDITKHINLEGDASFQDVYIEKMMLM